jgi:tetratricopeptide (TPR) repeat protein
MREGVWRLLATDLDGALASWLLAAKCDSNDRHGIAQTIAQAVPVEKIVEQVSANEVLLRRIYYIYLRQGQQENQRIIRDCYAACLASTWLSTHDAGQCADYQNVLSHMHLDLHDASQAQLAAAEVVKLRPTDFSARKWLAQVAGMNQDYSTALKHIKWCRSRDPESLELAELESGLQRSAVQRGQRR